jgi:hypothetical protein
VSKPELEAALETRCCDKIEARGGLALKLSIPGVRGFPDRTILVGGKVFFTEFKRLKTGRVSAQQERWAERLSKAGFKTYFVDTDYDFDTILILETGEA